MVRSHDDDRVQVRGTVGVGNTLRVSGSAARVAEAHRGVLRDIRPFEMVWFTGNELVEITTLPERR